MDHEPSDTPPKMGYAEQNSAGCAEFRCGFLYDGFEAISGKCRGLEGPNTIFASSQNCFRSKIGGDQVETGFLPVEGVKQEAREAWRGPRRTK